jgi:hypothetical protein
MQAKFKPKPKKFLENEKITGKPFFGKPKPN